MRLLITTQRVDVDDPILGFFHAWLLAFSKRCESIDVICLTQGRGDLPSNVRVHSLGKGTGGMMYHSARRVIYAFRFVSLAIRLRGSYDAVFVHMNPEYVVLGGLFWRLTGKRIALWYTHKSVDVKLRIAALLADVIFSASPESFRLKSRKVRIMGHGIETPTLRDAPRVRGRIVSVGRIEPSKRPEFMIRTLAELARFSAEARLMLIGPVEPSYKAKLEALIGECGVADRVTFSGPLPHRDVPLVLTEADLFLNASETGSLDKAVLEAAYFGALPVTTNPGCASFLQGFGELYAPQAQEEAVAKRLLHLFSLVPEERERMAGRLRERVVSDHSLGSLVGRMLAIIEAA